MTDSQQRRLDNQWTPETLFVHFDKLLTEKDRVLEEKDGRIKQMFRDLEKATQIAMTAAQEARNKSDQAYSERFRTGNKFRDTLKDQAANFIGRKEFDRLMAELRRRVSVTERWQLKRSSATAQRGKSGAFWAGIVMVLCTILIASAAVIGVVISFMQHKG